MDFSPNMKYFSYFFCNLVGFFVLWWNKKKIYFSFQNEDSTALPTPIFWISHIWFQNRAPCFHMLLLSLPFKPKYVGLNKIGDEVLQLPSGLCLHWWLKTRHNLSVTVNLGVRNRVSLGHRRPFGFSCINKSTTASL